MSDSLRELDREVDAAPQALPVGPGDVIAGKYRVDCLVGFGGMAAVMRATHLELDQSVAIKLLRVEQASRPDAVQRFLREARAAVRLRSSHVARVLDVGTAEIAPGTTVPFMVMELLEGSDLETVLVDRKRFAPAEAVDYILQACDAVAEAHGLGIIHRDLKPANLFLTARRDGVPLVKLLDFGISKSLDGPRDGHKITHEHAIIGSPAYMSPEQVRSSKDVDERADIWSLGAILFELLSGREPFIGETPADTLALILQEATPSMRTVAPDVPEELDAIVQKCLAKDPRARFQNIAELAAALTTFAPLRTQAVAPAWQSAADSASSQRLLASFESQRVAALDSQRVLVPASVQSAQPSAGSAVTPAPPKATSTTLDPPRRWWHGPAALGAGLGLVALAAVLGFFVWRSKAGMAQGALPDESTAVFSSAPSADSSAGATPADSASADVATAASASASHETRSRPRPAAPKANPYLRGVPRHRTDW